MIVVSGRPGVRATAIGSSSSGTIEIRNAVACTCLRISVNKNLAVLTA